MHDSLNALGGLSPMLLMQLGEVVYGGVGSGLYGMLAFAILGVFIAGLMIGRTPEYLGKKIEAYDMKMVSIVILATPLLVLGGTALAVSVTAGQAGVLNPGIDVYKRQVQASVHPDRRHRQGLHLRRPDHRHRRLGQVPGPAVRRGLHGPRDVYKRQLLIIAAIYVLINLFIDLLYLLVDPRVRY